MCVCYYCFRVFLGNNESSKLCEVCMCMFYLLILYYQTLKKTICMTFHHQRQMEGLRWIFSLVSLVSCDMLRCAVLHVSLATPSRSSYTHHINNFHKRKKKTSADRHRQSWNASFVSGRKRARRISHVSEQSAIYGDKSKAPPSSTKRGGLPSSSQHHPPSSQSSPPGAASTVLSWLGVFRVVDTPGVSVWSHGKSCINPRKRINPGFFFSLKGFVHREAQTFIFCIEDRS